MKKLFAILAVLFAATFMLTSCGGGGTTNPPTGGNNTPTVPAGDDTPTTPVGDDDTPTVPGDDDTPTVPGDDDTPTVPGDDDTPTVPGDDDTPTVPGDDDTPTTPTNLKLEEAYTLGSLDDEPLDGITLFVFHENKTCLITFVSSEETTDPETMEATYSYVETVTQGEVYAISIDTIEEDETVNYIAYFLMNNEDMTLCYLDQYIPGINGIFKDALDDTATVTLTIDSIMGTFVLEGKDAEGNNHVAKGVYEAERLSHYGLVVLLHAQELDGKVLSEEEQESQKVYLTEDRLVVPFTAPEGIQYDESYKWNGYLASGALFYVFHEDKTVEMNVVAYMQDNEKITTYKGTYTVVDNQGSKLTCDVLVDVDGQVSRQYLLLDNEEMTIHIDDNYVPYLGGMYVTEEEGCKIVLEVNGETNEFVYTVGYDDGDFVINGYLQFVKPLSNGYQVEFVPTIFDDYKLSESQSLLLKEPFILFEDGTFESVNVTFNPVFDEAYSNVTYGAEEIEIIELTFDGAGKAKYVYTSRSWDDEILKTETYEGTYTINFLASNCGVYTLSLVIDEDSQTKSVILYEDMTFMMYQNLEGFGGTYYYEEVYEDSEGIVYNYKYDITFNGSTQQFVMVVKLDDKRAIIEGRFEVVKNVTNGIVVKLYEVDITSDLPTVYLYEAIILKDNNQFEPFYDDSPVPMPGEKTYIYQDTDGTNFSELVLFEDGTFNLCIKTLLYDAPYIKLYSGVQESSTTQDNIIMLSLVVTSDSGQELPETERKNFQVILFPDTMEFCFYGKETSDEKESYTSFYIDAETNEEVNISLSFVSDKFTMNFTDGNDFNKTMTGTASCVFPGFDDLLVQLSVEKIDGKDTQGNLVLVLRSDGTFDYLYDSINPFKYFENNFVYTDIDTHTDRVLVLQPILDDTGKNVGYTYQMKYKIAADADAPTYVYEGVAELLCTYNGQYYVKLTETTLFYAKVQYVELSDDGSFFINYGRTINISSGYVGYYYDANGNYDYLNISADSMLVDDYKVTGTLKMYEMVDGKSVQKFIRFSGSVLETRGTYQIVVLYDSETQAYIATILTTNYGNFEYAKNGDLTSFERTYTEKDGTGTLTINYSTNMITYKGTDGANSWCGVIDSFSFSSNFMRCKVKVTEEVDGVTKQVTYYVDISSGTYFTVVK